jgi:uncharacterized phiE125 gp8 family phage protein
MISISERGAFTELPVTLKELQDQIKVYDDEESNYLNGLISKATDTAERFINNAIGKRSYTCIDDSPSETATIFLPVFPVISLTSIKVTYEDASESADIKTDVITLNTVPVQLKPKPFTFSTTLEAEYLTIIFTAGTGLNTPDHIKQAILLLASEWYENREASAGKKDEMSWGVKNLLGMSCEYNV